MNEEEWRLTVERRLVRLETKMNFIAAISSAGLLVALTLLLSHFGV